MIRRSLMGTGQVALSEQESYHTGDYIGTLAGINMLSRIKYTGRLRAALRSARMVAFPS